MNTSYNYADFIGMNIDSDIDPEWQEQGPMLKQPPDNDNHDKANDVDIESIDSKTPNKFCFPY